MKSHRKEETCSPLENQQSRFSIACFDFSQFVQLGQVRLLWGKKKLVDYRIDQAGHRKHTLLVYQWWLYHLTCFMYIVLYFWFGQPRVTITLYYSGPHQLLIFTSIIRELLDPQVTVLEFITQALNHTIPFGICFLYLP